jgi:hypothetical protein
LTGSVFALPVEQVDMQMLPANIRNFLSNITGGHPLTLPMYEFNTAGKKLYYNRHSYSATYVRNSFADDWATGTVWYFYITAFLSRYGEICPSPEFNPHYLRQQATEYEKKLEPELGNGAKLPMSLGAEHAPKVVTQNGGCAALQAKHFNGNMKRYLDSAEANMKNIDTPPAANMSYNIPKAGLNNPDPFAPYEKPTYYPDGTPAKPAASATPAAPSTPSMPNKLFGFGQKMQGHFDKFIDRGIDRIYNH